MDELIGRIVSNVGIDKDLATKAVGIILNFLNKSAPEDKMAALIKAIPGADGMLSSGGGGGMLSGMMGAMSAMNELTAAGLSMGQVQGVTKETIGFAKEKAGEETVDDIIASIPGLSQFI